MDGYTVFAERLNRHELGFRHEWKHPINRSDLFAIRQRLRVVASPDPHAIGGRYRIRSLYFDTPDDRALYEKLDGLSYREKYRIRYYNDDTSYLVLEKKCKWNRVGTKFSTRLSAQEAQRIVDGDTAWMPESGRPLLAELYSRMRGGLRPRTIVDYTREPFVYQPGNVRVTLDYDIRTGLSCVDFLNADCVTVPAGDPVILLEVKWDAFLPDVIRDAVQLKGRRESAFSKYAQCRIYD